MLYTPLLPGAAGGTLEPRHVVVPLREQLQPHRAAPRHRRSAPIPSARVVRVRSLGGREDELPYDQLIVALGSTSRTLPIPGLAEHAIGFKTLAEAIALRNRLVQTLEQAEIEHDEAVRARAADVRVRRRAATPGSRACAELQDFAADLVERYPRCAPRRACASCSSRRKDRVMTEIQPDLAAFASAELRRRGIEIHTEHDDRARPARLGRALHRRDRARPARSSGRRASSRTRWWRSSGCRWTAAGGSRPTASARSGPARRLGDRRRRRGPRPGEQGQRRRRRRRSTCCARPRSRPTTSAHALAGEPQRRRPFRYRTLGVFVDMGRHQAVASTLGIKWRGFPAWFLARTYHLALMPGTARRARLVTDWTTGLLFGRDSAELGQLGHPPGLEAHERAAGRGRQRPAATKSSAAPAFASTTERARRQSFIRFGGTARSIRTGRPSRAEPDQVEREAHRERVHRAAAREVQRVGGRHRRRALMRSGRRSARATAARRELARGQRVEARRPAVADAELAVRARRASVVEPDEVERERGIADRVHGAAARAISSPWSWPSPASRRQPASAAAASRRGGGDAEAAAEVAAGGRRSGARARLGRLVRNCGLPE